jgi:DNA helicase-2/ATP-dependent DNA helicase PcrA
VSQRDFLSELNDAQRLAAQHISGPLMVIAGAGSGKTRVLTYRIAHMIQNGIDPFSILSLTFTNKAAREMKERIANLMGEDNARNIWMGTFHSVFARILRSEADRIGYPRNFSIYDSADSKSLIRDILKEMSLDDKIYKPGMVQNRISSCKNSLIGAADYPEQVELVSDDHAAKRPMMAEVYKKYDQRLFQAGAMDFDDLLFKTNILFRDHADVLHRYQHKFQFIMVDEYQDTNFSQYLIVKQLAAVNENLCVVGDDAQSIYAFRGANIQNILNFRKDYPDYSLYKLEQNYRSTKVIVDAANSIIGNNKNQIKKNVWTANDEGSKIRLHQAPTDNEEGMFVANTIFKFQKEDGGTYHDFAILYRTNAQSRAMEEALRKLNIPYKIYGGLSFYQRKEIKDLLAYFRLTANHKDEEALKRVINYPARGIGKTTLEKLIVGASEREISIWEMIGRGFEVGISGATANKLNEFVTMIQSFATELTTKPAYDLGMHIAAASGLLVEVNADRTPEGVARVENIQELLAGLKEFSERELEDGSTPSLSDFLIDVALLTDTESSDVDETKCVSLMTIHSAKGLEFPNVFIVGMEENLFPSQMSLNAREDLEEERRLFYVALTRAEKRAILSYANSRFKWGQFTYCEPSRFIEEIDEKFLETTSGKKTPQQSRSFDFGEERGKFSGGMNKLPLQDKPKSSFPSSAPAAPPMPPQIDTTKLKKVDMNAPVPLPAGDWALPHEIQVGVDVQHEKFGKGKVIKVEGESPNEKATVFFPSEGQKQLLLKFAKLKIVGA